MKYSFSKGDVFKIKIHLRLGVLFSEIPSLNFRWKYSKRGIRRGKDKREESIIRGADLPRNHFLQNLVLIKSNP